MTSRLALWRLFGRAVPGIVAAAWWLACTVATLAQAQTPPQLSSDDSAAASEPEAGTVAVPEADAPVPNTSQSDPSYSPVDAGLIDTSTLNASPSLAEVAPAIARPSDVQNTAASASSTADTREAGVATSTAAPAVPCTLKPKASGGHGPRYSLGDNLQLQTFPSRDMYPRYLADPRQPMMKGMNLFVFQNDTPQTGSPLFEFTLGGRAKLLRLHTADKPEEGLEFSGEAAFIGRFDPTENYDGIGWDGYYSARFAYRTSKHLAFKLAAQHDSGHVADEYIVKTMRKRMTYTREEMALGVMLDFFDYFRGYMELGYAFHRGNPKLMKLWRGQAGLEVVYGRFYTATNVTLWQELDFKPTVTAQLGLITRDWAAGRRFGICLQFEDGRSVLGEFFRDNNRTLGLGFWADL